MAFRVFVSHSSKDREIVNSLYSVLKQSGIEIYAALFSREPSIQVPQKILEGMKRSDCVLVLLTSNSIMSDWVLTEIGMAKTMNKLIIPFVEKGVEVPSVLVGIDYIEFDEKDPLKTIESIGDYFKHLILRRPQDVNFGLGLTTLLLGLVILASISGKDEETTG